jgi:hypothetical protein
MLQERDSVLGDHRRLQINSSQQSLPIFPVSLIDDEPDEMPEKPVVLGTVGATSPLRLFI